MMARQLYNVNQYNKENFVHMFFLSKSKRIEVEKKIQTYFNSHPIALWAAIFIGIPMAILLVVALTTTIFGLMILILENLQ